MMITAAVTLRELTFVTTDELAIAEKPSPPYSSGMIIPMKPFCLMKSKISGEIPPSWWTFQSSIFRHSSSHGPSRKLRSFGESGFGSNSRSFFQSGAPEKSSASHQTVPASSAVFSVSLIRGKIGARNFITSPETSVLRTGGNPNRTVTTTKSAASTTKSPVEWIPWTAQTTNKSATGTVPRDERAGAVERTRARRSAPIGNKRFHASPET
jgi:hypothetical protein